jgi:hypothetical protein
MELIMPHFPKLGSARPIWIAAAVALAVPAAPAFSHQLAPPQQTCTTLNCNVLELPGVINSHPPIPPIANQWVNQIAGLADSCMRFQVTAENRDLAMSVVARDGKIFTNDRGGDAACRQCPIVVIKSARNGFYTVVIAAANGEATEATFTLKAGLYNEGNSPNCDDPTHAR